MVPTRWPDGTIKWGKVIAVQIHTRVSDMGKESAFSFMLPQLEFDMHGTSVRKLMDELELPAVWVNERLP